VGGSGTINTTGTLTSTGGSTVFGTTNDCNSGPCSGTTLTCTFTNKISPVSKAICSGSSAGTLTSVNSATAPGYQWLSSTDNITYVNASGVSTNSTYVTPGLTQTTWYKVKVTSSSPCSSTSAAMQVTVQSSGGWLGGTSNDWGYGQQLVQPYGASKYNGCGHHQCSGHRQYAYSECRYGRRLQEPDHQQYFSGFFRLRSLRAQRLR